MNVNQNGYPLLIFSINFRSFGSLGFMFIKRLIPLFACLTNLALSPGEESSPELSSTCRKFHAGPRRGLWPSGTFQLSGFLQGGPASLDLRPPFAKVWWDPRPSQTIMPFQSLPNISFRTFCDFLFLIARRVAESATKHRIQKLDSSTLIPFDPCGRLWNFLY